MEDGALTAMPPQVLLHGFAGGPALWDDMLAAQTLSPGEPSPVRLALPFHRQPGVLDFAAAAQALWRTLDPAPVHLIGYSLGARLSLAMACAAPNRVAQLTLIGVHPGLRNNDERAARREQDAAWQKLLRQGDMATFTRAWAAQPLFSGLATTGVMGERRRAQLEAERLGHNAYALADSLAVLGLAAMPDFWDAAGTLPMPVHLITGARDLKFCALAKALLPRLRRGRHSIVPGAGHCLPLEAPAALAACLAYG